jgi:hypothetical protein
VSNKEEEKLYETFYNIGDGLISRPGLGPGRPDRRSAEKEEKETGANYDAGDTRAKERRDADKQSARQHAGD